MEIEFNGPRKDSAREEIRAASHDVQKREQGKEEDPVLSPKREDTRIETEKAISKGKDPRVTSPSGKPNKPGAMHPKKNT